MKIEVLILEEGLRTFKSKGEQKTEYLFTGRDANKNPGESRCANNLVYEPTAEDLDKYKGKMVDERAIIEVKNIRVDFNGNVRLTGTMTPISGAAAAKKAA